MKTSSCSRSARVGVEEDHALLGELLLELVVDDLALVLRADAGEVLLLRLRDAELVPGVLDVGGQVLPRLGLVLGRLDVVEDRVEVDLVQARHAAPGRHRPREEVVERLVAELPHPVRLVLVRRDRVDQLVREAAARLEEVVLRLVRVREAVLRQVVGTDLLDDLVLGLAHTATSLPLLVAGCLELLGELRAALLDDPAADEHVHEVGLDVVEDPLVVRDHERAHVGADELLHAAGDDLQRVDVEAGVGLVEHRDLRAQHRHLQDLDPLLLAAREPVVQVARRELAAHLQAVHLREELLAELRHRHRVLDAAVPRLARRR